MPIPITNIIVHCGETAFAHEFIADVFYEHNIAKLKSVTLKQVEGHYYAHIALLCWSDTEIAHCFIKSLRDFTAETRLWYSDDQYWVVKNNPDESTIVFDDDFYELIPPNIAPRDDYSWLPLMPATDEPVWTEVDHLEKSVDGEFWDLVDMNYNEFERLIADARLWDAPMTEAELTSGQFWDPNSERLLENDDVYLPETSNRIYQAIYNDQVFRDALINNAAQPRENIRNNILIAPSL